MASHTVSDCECAYCIPIRANVQLCDAIVRINKGGTHSIMFKEEPPWDRPVNVALTALAILAKDRNSLYKKGEGATCTGNGFKMYVECVVSRKMWKLCFHAEPLDEDPT